MSDLVVTAVESAHAANDTCVVFPLIELVPDVEVADTSALALTFRVGAVDGGRFLLNLCGERPGTVDVVLIFDDGGLPGGFIDDLNSICLDLDFTQSLDAPLKSLFGKAVKLYRTMNKMPDGTDYVNPANALTDGESVGDVSPNGGADKDSPHQLPQPSHIALPVRKPQSYKAPDFSPSASATATLTRQLQMLRKSDTESLGFTVTPAEDSLYIWCVRLFFRDLSTDLAQDLALHPTHKFVELECRFPSQYPFAPPFCRVVAPAFRRGTGFVQPRGGLCMELLTTAGWTPANSMDAVCIQIYSFLLSGDGRLDLNNTERVLNYTYEGALKDFSSIVNSHGWNVERGYPDADRSRKRARQDKLAAGIDPPPRGEH